MDIPLFKAIIDNNQEGIYGISLVEYPAVERNWLAFSKDTKKKFEKFEVQSDEKHELLGVIMLCDVPIYRRDETFGEYYLVFDRDTIEKMSRNMLRNGSQNYIDVEHQENWLDFGSVEMMEVYIKDSAMGLVPKGFEDIPDGSLMGRFKVNNIDIWEKVKSGEVKGFSLAGWFDYKEAFSKAANKDEEEILVLLSKIENKLKNKN